ncbi:copper-translocating P-type ATPase, partial [bacterium]
EKITLDISGMHCASCAGNIEGALRKISGVKSARVNFALEKAQIEFEPERVGARDLIVAIEKAGYKAKAPEESPDRERQEREKEVKTLKIKFIISIILAGLLMYAAMGHCIGLSVHTFIIEHMALIQFILATGVLSCGYQFFIRGFSAVMKSRTANMDTLVALGVGSAYLYSLFVTINIWLGSKQYGSDNLYYEVAAFLIAFILLGRYLEAITKRKTSEAIRKLWNLRPKAATVIRRGAEEEIPVDALVVGDIVVIKPGERIPVDGKVIEGYSGVDESLVTGESLPVEKNTGDTVISGSINKTGSFKFKATRVGKETVLSQIIKLVEEAQMSKAPVEVLADRIAAVFVPSVLVIALISFFAWILLGKSFIFALSVFITVLIIACPCTLGLATPTAVMVGTGLAAENGIIIKNAASLQAAHGIKAIIFDKTGTLTIGKPRVTDVISYEQDEIEVLGIAASLEKKSEHPLADAVVAAAKAKGIFLTEIQAFESLPGKGISGKAGDATIFLGNRKLMEEKKIDIQKAGVDLDKLENEGKTVMFLARKGRLIGLIAVRDTLKEFSKEAIDRLKAMGKEVIMLTGDNKRTALAIAKELGIDKVLAEVLPKDKVDEIKRLQGEGMKAAFVGDGLNDAPALTQADLGIAIGSGTDVAIEAGDIILIKDDLRDVVMALDLSRYAMKKIKQNLFFSFFYNSLGIPVAAGLLYPFTGFLLNPMVAGTAMAFSSVSVVSNSLLMRRYKRGARSSRGPEFH